MTKWRLLSVAVIALLAPAVATGRQQQPTFRATANGVVVSTLVTLRGVPVDDLAASDFVVTDNGNPQAVTATRDNRPLDVTLWAERVAVDMWSSEVRRSVAMLSGGLENTDRVRVLIGSEVNREVMAWQAPPAAIPDVLTVQVAGEPTPASHAAGGPSDQCIFDTLMTLGPLDRRQVVVGFFVGVQGRELGADVLAVTAASSDAVIYMMGLPPRGPISPLWFAGVGRIASITGGQLLVATDPGENGDWSGQFRVRMLPGVPVDFGGATVSAFKDASAAVAQIVRDIRHSYLLSFVPRDPKPGWHSLAVKVTKPKFEKAVVRARQRYFVAGK
jgi:hypothetical protein